MGNDSMSPSNSFKVFKHEIALLSERRFLLGMIPDVLLTTNTS